MILLGIVGFLAVGLALGLLGGGGGILAVPVLVYVLGIAPKAAVPLSLIVVGASAAVGAFVRWRRGELRLQMVSLFATCSVTAAALAPRLAHDISRQTRMTVSIVTMLLAAIVMWRRSRRPVQQITPATETTLPAPAAMIPLALTAGTLTGLVGVGGGFLIVPALNGILGMPMPIATATSLGVIVLNTMASGISYWGEVTLDPALLLAIIGAAMVGMTIGTRIAPRFSSRTLTQAFASLLVAVSLFMVWQEYILTPPS